MNHKGRKRIETKRLILRPFRMEDAEPMYRNWASDQEVTRYLTWNAHTSVEDTKQILTSWTESYSGPANYQWAIELKETGEPIGSIAAVEMNENTEAATIGYCIGRKWCGQGIMPEALCAVISFFFEEVAARCVNACHDPRNPNSGKVMQKCSMKLEGTRRQAGFNNQGICDEVWYSILKQEYFEKKVPCIAGFDRIKEQSMELNWVDGFEINVRIENGTAIISANKEGLLSLANHLKSLAEEPSGSHLHLDTYNSLENDSAELILEKL